MVRMAVKRIPIPKGIETAVLLLSRRRCAFCFGLDGVAKKKRPTRAHQPQAE